MTRSFKQEPRIDKLKLHNKSLSQPPPLILIAPSRCRDGTSTIDDISDIGAH